MAGKGHKRTAKENVKSYKFEPAKKTVATEESRKAVRLELQRLREWRNKSANSTVLVG